MSSKYQKALSAQPTIFVGRRQEMVQLAGLLENDRCRLLTIGGPGGSGKTRLALEVVSRVKAQFEDGVYFVPLQAINSSANLPYAIADAVGYTLRSAEDPTTQLSHYLNQKKRLIILDNFEPLISSNSLRFVRELIVSAPQLKMLITSREALNLRDEWLFTLSGMRFPEGSHPLDTEDYDAIQLFVAYAQQTQRDFSVDENLDCISRICRQVEGLPLALELSASWLRYMTCEQIADEIAHDVNTLQSTLRDVPERHRSMQTVLDNSWQRLKDEERDTLTRLAVFPGDFGRDAATYVADVQLLMLTALVDKSMLKVGADGYYSMHGLLRQYIKGQFNADRSQVQNRFCDYYAGFLSSLRMQMIGGGQIQAVNAIETELDNLRLAWAHAVTQKDATFFEKAAHSLSLFFQFTSRFVEGSKLFREAVQSLSKSHMADVGRALVYLLVDCGWFDIRLGNLEQAEKTLNACLDLYSQFALPPVYGHGTDPRLPLGIVAVIRGDYKRALSYADQASESADTYGQTSNRSFVHYLRANALFSLGQFRQAEQEAERAHHLAEEQEDIWFAAYCLNVRGDAVRVLGDVDEAKRHYLESYRIREAFNDPEGKAVALNHLGQIALLQDDNEQAQRYYQHSCVLYQELQDRGGLADVQQGLGAVALAKNEYTQARSHLREALIISFEIRHLGLLFSTLNHIANLLYQTGVTDRSHVLLYFVRDHPSTSREAQEQAQSLLHSMDFDTDEFQSAESKDTNLESLVNDLIQTLAEPGDLTLSPPQANLVEPLTKRELEVLHLLAKGMTNQDIAENLTVVIGTVKAHNHSIYGKLGVNNRTEAVVRARELNLI